MCSGGGGSTKAADPVVMNVTGSGTTQSAAQINADRQRRKRGAGNNAVSNDRTILGGSSDNAVKNDLG